MSFPAKFPFGFLNTLPRLGAIGWFLRRSFNFSSNSKSKPFFISKIASKIGVLMFEYR